MFTQSQFFAAAQTYDTANDYLSVINSIDPTFPVSSGVDSQPGNIGWQLFGWNNATLNSYQISAQFFWNQLAGSPFASFISNVAPVAVTAPITPPAPTPAATVVAQQTGANVATNNTNGSTTINPNTNIASTTGNIASTTGTANTGSGATTNNVANTGTSGYFSIFNAFGINDPELSLFGMTIPIGEMTAAALGGCVVLLMFLGGGSGEHHHRGE